MDGFRTAISAGKGCDLWQLCPQVSRVWGGSLGRTHGIGTQARGFLAPVPHHRKVLKIAFADRTHPLA